MIVWLKKGYDTIKSVKNDQTMITDDSRFLPHVVMLR